MKSTTDRPAARKSGARPAGRRQARLDLVERLGFDQAGRGNGQRRVRFVNRKIGDLIAEIVFVTEGRFRNWEDRKAVVQEALIPAVTRSQMHFRMTDGNRGTVEICRGVSGAEQHGLAYGTENWRDGAA